MKTIVLDAGHGGTDPGAVNGRRLEKDDNLRMAQAVQRQLTNQGQKVIMTRDKDTYVPLLERSAISNNNNADMFVSFHRNASDNPGVGGTETWIQQGSPAANAAYAQNVQNRLVSAGVQSNRGVRAGNYSVLRNTAAPAMLLELGFISNAVDNDFFDRNFDAYATAITRGILESLGEPYTPSGTGGSGSETIKTIQATLNSRYNTNLQVDGIPGARTKRALITALQIELNTLFNTGLLVDGIWGPKTRAAVPNIAIGTSGSLVYLLQAALYVNGYPVTLDGIFGPGTQQAVKAFQKQNGLTDDGIAGPNTFEKLFT